MTARNAARPGFGPNFRLGFGLGFGIVLIASTLAGCGDDAAPTGDAGTDSSVTDASSGQDANFPPTADDVPCNVAEIISANCATCHSAQPKFGAPMPLDSWAALQAISATDLGKQVFELISGRVHSRIAPMPPAPNPRLSEEDMATLDAWINAGGPQKLTDEVCMITPPPTMDELPCEPTHSFLAHSEAGATEPFDVPVEAGNLYQCFTFRSPFAANEQATAWGPAIDDERVLHHWILYRTSEEQVDGGVSPCNMPSDATFMMGWAPGGGVAVMPDDVGLELKQDAEEWLILQIHYWNTTGIEDSRDRSGVHLCTTETPRAQTAGVLTLGSLGINLPARSSDNEVVGTCAANLTRLLPAPLNILSSGPHMHELGTRIRTDITRDGVTTNLVAVEPWDFNSQSAYWHEPGMQIRPGDTVTTTCVYDNPTDSRVTYGSRTEDEMCFNFALVYPIELLGNLRACL